MVNLMFINEAESAAKLGFSVIHPFKVYPRHYLAGLTPN